MKPGRVGGLFVVTGLCILVGPSLLAGQPGNPQTETEIAPAVQSDLANGLYLVLRWTGNKEDLLPLLENEILIEHDPRVIEPDSEDPILYVTVGPARRVLFQQMKRLEPVALEDGRINLQVTLSDDRQTSWKRCLVSILAVRSPP